MNDRFTKIVIAIARKAGRLSTDDHAAQTVAMFANDTDLASSQLERALDDLSRSLKRDVDKAANGLRIDHALGSSTAREINEHRIQLEERARALRLMVKLVFGLEGKRDFDDLLESSTHDPRELEARAKG